MAQSATRFTRRKKETIFVDGYFIDHADVATPGFNQNEEIFHFFGEESPETDIQHNYGTLTLGLKEKFASNALLDLLCGYNPDLPRATNPRQYWVPTLGSVHIWANAKDALNQNYIRSWFLGNWSPGMPTPSGNPNDKADRTVTGNGDLIRQFEGLWIDMKKIASGASVALGAVPVIVPQDTVYGISIKAINAGPPFDFETVEVSTSMISPAGLVSFAPIMAALTRLTTVTHAAVYFLQSGSGVYPSVLPNKLYA